MVHLWDSFSMYSCDKELKLFNKAYTFDRADSIKYQIEYKPNFYIKYIGKLQKEIEYDLCFIGKFTPARLSVINKILSQSERAGIRYFIILWPAYKILFHNYLIYLFLKIINFHSAWTKDYQLHYEANERLLKEKFVVENKMNFEEVQSHFQSSNVILDLPFERQTGFTHRVIEALANGKKVITSNSGIKNERFYNPEQIHILDNHNPLVDCKWIKKKLEFPVDNYFKELELSVWIKSIIDVRIA
mgnify:CR=1 FL=1